MNPHFFTALFYFAFIWFKVQGSGFKVQGSRFRVHGSRFKGLKGGGVAHFVILSGEKRSCVKKWLI